MDNLRCLLSYVLGTVGEWLIDLAFRVSDMPDPTLTPEEVDRMHAVFQKLYRENHQPQDPRS